jgi:hypothetical protein
MKNNLMSELLRLTKLQGAALKEDNIDEFAVLLEKKQTCIDKINEITNSNSSALDDADREILRETAEIDKLNNEEFNRQLEDVKMQLRKIRSLKKRDTIYSNPYDVSFEEGIFIDKK